MYTQSYVYTIKHFPLDISGGKIYTLNNIKGGVYNNTSPFCVKKDRQSRGKGVYIL